MCPRSSTTILSALRTVESRCAITITVRCCINVCSARCTSASDWTVSPGGAISGKAGKTTLTDTATGTVLTCKSATTAGTLKSGSGLAGAAIATITSLSFATCTGPQGITFTVTSSNLPWTLNAVSYTASSGTAHATLTGIDATLSGPGCSATIDGTAAGAGNGMVKATYVNSTRKLTISPAGGTLHIYNVSGCSGLLASGDTAAANEKSTITPPQDITTTLGPPAFVKASRGTKAGETPLNPLVLPPGFAPYTWGTFTCDPAVPGFDPVVGGHPVKGDPNPNNVLVISGNWPPPVPPLGSREFTVTGTATTVINGTTYTIPVTVKVTVTNP